MAMSSGKDVDVTNCNSRPGSRIDFFLGEEDIIMLVDCSDHKRGYRNQE